jgi:rRNA maturation protein Nop10
MDNLTLPYRLPSFGRLYDGAIPEGDVVLLPIRGEQEELLAGAKEADNYVVVLQHVTQQLIQLPPEFHFPDLLITDWMACLLNVLSFSYGAELHLQPKCPSCGDRNIHTALISDLECFYANEIEERFSIPYTEPFAAEPLPRSREVVQYRRLRLRDLNRIQEYTQRIKMRSPVAYKDPTGTYTLATQIHAINDKVNLSELELMSWVRKSLSMDLNALRQHIDGTDTGYNLRPRFTCTKCGEVFEVQLPLDFFRQLSTGTG